MAQPKTSLRFTPGLSMAKGPRPDEFKGKELNERKIILKDSKLLTEAGVFSIVLECVESSLSKEISKTINIPTIGIGAGKYCDGQVLVMHDMLGINTEFKPRFLRKYLNIHEQATDAIKSYINDVKNNDFPNESESY